MERPAAEPPRVGPTGEDAPFCILYMSGTTGKPKGAVLTHLGVISSCLGSRDHLRLGADEVLALAVPVSHVTGIVLVRMLSLGIGGKVVVQRAFKAPGSCPTTRSPTACT